MKILMLADKMDIGGAETHIYELSRSLSSMGHQIKILSDGGTTADLLKEQNVEFEQTDIFRQLAISPVKASRKLWQVLREFKPDAVHAHTRKTLFAANLASMLIPFPLVFTAHAKFSTSPIKRIFTKTPPHTIAVSEDIKAHFASRFGSECITVIENGIDSKRFSPNKQDIGAMRILNVSRLDRDSSKTAELLCRIAPRLCRLDPSAEIEIVGGGNDYSRIALIAQNANREIGRNAVKCVGSQSDIVPFLHRASLFVGVSRAALEAMFVGLPVIICGNEGYFGLCERKDFDTCSRENFCARGYPQADENRLLSDIFKAYRTEDKNSLYLRQTAQEKYDSELTARKVEKIYFQALDGFRNSQKYDVVLCGYYGFGNLGDEMVLESIKKELSPWRTAIIGASGDGRIGRFELSSAVKAIRSSRLFVLGGGSLLQNSTSRRSLEYYLMLLRIAKLFGKRTMLYANGIGPILGERAVKRCRRALSSVDVAGFRDTESFAIGKTLLNSKAVSYLTCDPVLCQRLAKEVKNRLMFFIRGEDLTEALEVQIKKALLRFRREVSPDIEIVFASMNRKKDEITALKLSDAMPFPTNRLLFTSGQKLSWAIASSKIVVSSRLHALITAASANRPFVALCHDPKLEAFAKECMLPQKLYPSLSSCDLETKLFEALKCAFCEAQKISSHLAKRVPEMTKLSARDKDELWKLLGQR